MENHLQPCRWAAIFYIQILTGIRCREDKPGLIWWCFFDLVWTVYCAHRISPSVSSDVYFLSLWMYTTPCLGALFRMWFIHCNLLKWLQGNNTMTFRRPRRRSTGTISQAHLHLVCILLAYLWMRDFELKQRARVTSDPPSERLFVYRTQSHLLSFVLFIRTWHLWKYRGKVQWGIDSRLAGKCLCVVNSIVFGLGWAVNWDKAKNLKHIAIFSR